MQTVAALPSDKAPEQEKETVLWGREGWRRDRMSEGVKAEAMWEMSTKHCGQENVSFWMF